MARTKIAPLVKPYQVWFDCRCFFSSRTFDTAEEAVTHSEQCRSYWHRNRVLFNGKEIAITLPRFSE